MCAFGIKLECTLSFLDGLATFFDKITPEQIAQVEIKLQELDICRVVSRKDADKKPAHLPVA